MSDVHAADLPGNSIAAEHFERTWRANVAEVTAEAKADLIARCRQPGQARSGYLEYCSEVHIATVPQYVDMLEMIDAKAWRDAYDMHMRASIEQGREA